MIKTLRKSGIRELEEKFSLAIAKGDEVRLDDGVSPNLLIINGTPAYFFHGDQWVPTLKHVQQSGYAKKITVDMGAIPYLIKGAHVMRPGIKKVDASIEARDVVLIIDEKFGKGIAVGKADFPAEDILRMGKGKCVTILHYVGDKVWNYTAK